MSSSHNNTNSSSSYTQSPLPDGGATTGANNLKFKCSVCGKRFRTEENRNLHRSEHYLPWRRFSI
ncbi:hypothetical protein YC2023_040297 [Brassica napus]